MAKRAGGDSERPLSPFATGALQAVLADSAQSIMAALRHARERGVDVFKSFTNEPENTGNSPIKTT